MAHLWIRSRDGVWAALPLETRPLSLDALLVTAHDALPSEAAPDEFAIGDAGRARSGRSRSGRSARTSDDSAENREGDAPTGPEAAPARSEPAPANAAPATPAPATPAPATPDTVLLVPFGDDPVADSWALVAGTCRQVAVNGLPLASGLRVLEDRDELRLDSASVFFSTERLAAVEPFPGAERATFCPRCKKEIARDAPAVRCPGCGLWHHEDSPGDRECWSYSGRCASCGHDSERREFRWSPEDL